MPHFQIKWNVISTLQEYYKTVKVVVEQEHTITQHCNITSHRRRLFIWNFTFTLFSRIDTKITCYNTRTLSTPYMPNKATNSTLKSGRVDHAVPMKFEADRLCQQLSLSGHKTRTHDCGGSITWHITSIKLTGMWRQLHTNSGILSGLCSSNIYIDLKQQKLHYTIISRLFPHIKLVDYSAIWV